MLFKTGVTNKNGESKASLESVWTPSEDYVGYVIVK